jgi:hypothetical protein
MLRTYTHLRTLSQQLISVADCDSLRSLALRFAARARLLANREPTVRRYPKFFEPLKDSRFGPKKEALRVQGLSLSDVRIVFDSIGSATFHVTHPAHRGRNTHFSESLFDIKQCVYGLGDICRSLDIGRVEEFRGGIRNLILHNVCNANVNERNRKRVHTRFHFQCRPGRS